MINLLHQLKKRRMELGLKQNDMLLRTGVSRQQYQRLESKGNPRLATLELIANGLNSEIMLIPKEKRSAVLAALEECAIDEQNPDSQCLDNTESQPKKKKSLSDDPWQGLLGDSS
ncbi:helix-turn-helix transcriptional regulator [uncultured Endozoicomonas sp.]|uniref:helix-turn-helix domain-containing protein n=1 Tax=uncultured Endozoicomonas sp. TaxID=432652 RepID=UPI00262D8956|nr:helix-turn-helix transcriptional regulator [uncultured Endozoicomonas sp.]